MMEKPVMDEAVASLRQASEYVCGGTMHADCFTDASRAVDLAKVVVASNVVLVPRSTAAHPTLPRPSWRSVTAAGRGRSSQSVADWPATPCKCDAPLGRGPRGACS